MSSKDSLARDKIREILDKPELTEEDASTVAACVAFLGSNMKTADNFSQALLDTAESLNTGLCVRCGKEPGKGPASCLICQGIRNVQTLKLVKQNSHVETLEEQLEREADEKYREEHELDFNGKPLVYPGEEDKTPEVDEEKSLELERTIELHQEYPHTFWDGRLNKTKAVDTLTTLETMIAPTEADTKAIAHIRGHLELDVVDEDLEPGARGPVTLEPALVPWSEKELDRLRMNQHLPIKVLASLFKDRTVEEIKAKLYELG